ncbi:MAG: hypothetical protein J7K75_07995 [Desulfuromonas sp.]|nr:hypothetical protein [Desulfuromonas sp.]
MLARLGFYSLLLILMESTPMSPSSSLCATTDSRNVKATKERLSYITHCGWVFLPILCLTPSTNPHFLSSLPSV